jgi:hypothetical protein
MLQKWLFPTFCLCCEKNSKTLFCPTCQGHIVMNKHLIAITAQCKWGKILETNSMSISFYQNIAHYPDLIKSCIGFYIFFFFHQSLQDFEGVYIYSKSSPFWLHQTASRFKRILSLPLIRRKKKCENKKVLLLSDRYQENLQKDPFIQTLDSGSLLLSLL